MTLGTRTRSAFTLLELLLVVAVLALIMAVALPSLAELYADAQVTAAADHLMARFAEARVHAIEEVRPYRFAVMPGQSGYKLAPDSPEYWGGTADASSGTDATPALVVEDVMPNNIRFNLGAGAASGADSGAYVTILTFLETGACDEDKTIRLELEGAQAIEIRVRALSGSVSKRTVDMGDNR